jgi:hypothetical protein
MSSWDTAQVAVSSSAAVLLHAGIPGGANIALTNTGSIAIFVSNSPNVTTATGALLPGGVGAYKVIPTNQPVYGIAQSGTPTIGVEAFY